MSSYGTEQSINWLKTLDVKADRVIDIGGSQNPIKGRTKSWDVKEYKILDLPEPHECKQNPDVIGDIQIKMSDELIEDINPLTSPVLKKFFSAERFSFDIAFCLGVSEYWYDPLQALRNIAILLKSGGILYITFHFVYVAHNPVKQDYLRYTPRGMEKLLEEAGFEILEMNPRLELGNFIYDAMVRNRMKLARGYDKHHWVGGIIKARKK